MIMIIDIFDVVKYVFFIVMDYVVIEGGYGNIKIFLSRCLECNCKIIVIIVVFDYFNYNRLGIDIYFKVYM